MKEEAVETYHSWGYFTDGGDNAGFPPVTARDTGYCIEHSNSADETVYLPRSGIHIVRYPRTQLPLCIFRGDLCFDRDRGILYPRRLRRTDSVSACSVKIHFNPAITESGDNPRRDLRRIEQPILAERELSSLGLHQKNIEVKNFVDTRIPEPELR